MQPLHGLKVLELTHVVAGPSVGLILADMGADVIRVERPDGGHPRGPTKAAFAFLNRNKRSVAIDLKKKSGTDAFLRLIETTDVLIDNFAPGVMDRLGLAYDTLSEVNPGLIYLAVKGFLPGPYAGRPLLDEPAQIMGGLAYMTGPEGTPLRVGASVVDVGGAAYGAIAILGALYQRRETGRGQSLALGLFETVAYWNAIAMADGAWSGEPCVPFPSRPQAARFGWGVYQLFDTSDGRRVFIGLTSDAHWRKFCAEFGLDELGADPRLATNLDRAESRPWLIPLLEDELKKYTSADLQERLARINVPFAPLQRPDELFGDPQLATTGQLSGTPIPGLGVVRLPNLPTRSSEYRFEVRRRAPGLGEQTREVLTEAGYSSAELDRLESEEAILTGSGLAEQWSRDQI